MKRYEVKMLRTMIVEGVECTPEIVIGTIETDFAIDTLLAAIQNRNAEAELVGVEVSVDVADVIQESESTTLDESAEATEPTAEQPTEPTAAELASPEPATPATPAAAPSQPSTLATFLADGLDEATAQALIANGLDVESIKSLIAEGFELTELEDIGKSRAKKIVKIYGPK